MSIKRKTKLNRHTRKSLEKKGKKDAQNKVIQVSDYKVVPFSPFFNEEISLCLANIHEEYEKFLNYKKKLMKKCIRYNLKKNKITTYISKLTAEKTRDEEYLNELNNIVFDDIEINNDIERLLGEKIQHNGIDVFDDTVLKEFRVFEKRAPIEVEKNNIKIKKKDLIESIDNYPNKCLKYNKKISKVDGLSSREIKKVHIRFEMFISKCNQHYSLTAARISAYWNGALGGFSNNSLSCNFNTEEILFELKREIAEIKTMGVDF